MLAGSLALSADLLLLGFLLVTIPQFEELASRCNWQLGVDVAWTDKAYIGLEGPSVTRGLHRVEKLLLLSGPL